MYCVIDVPYQLNILTAHILVSLGNINVHTVFILSTAVYACVYKKLDIEFSLYIFTLGIVCIVCIYIYTKVYIYIFF